MRKVTVFQERLDSLSLSMSVSFTLLSLKNITFDLDKKKACVSFYYRRHQSEKGKVLLSLPSAFSVLVADFLHLRFAPLPPPPLHLGCWVVHNQMTHWLELPGCSKNRFLVSLVEYPECRCLSRVFWEFSVFQSRDSGGDNSSSRRRSQKALSDSWDSEASGARKRINPKNVD